jgi:hypothetical protein
MTEKMRLNKKRYLELINSITIKDADLKGLNNWLEKSDFFIAPATLRYHGSYPGGLCEHSLNVYDNLVKLASIFATRFEPQWDTDAQGNPIKETLRTVEVNQYSADTLKIVALMHDIGKTNIFTTYKRNVKNEETGKWEQKQEYKVKEANERFIYGNHEQNSEFIAHTFFPLSVEESSAILNHLGGMGADSAQMIAPIVYSKYSLALLLHMADLIACYIDEKVL